MRTRILLPLLAGIVVGNPLYPAFALPIRTGLGVSSSGSTTAAPSARVVQSNTRTGSTAGISNGAPPSPGNQPALSATASSVSVSWSYYQVDYLVTFILWRRDITGTLQAVHSEPYVAGWPQLYTWVDTDQNLGAQCYFLQVVNSFGSSWSEREQCTVRPDPKRFPQNPPPDTKQWGPGLPEFGVMGLNNDDVEQYEAVPLHNTVQDDYLGYNSDQSCGAQLGWGLSGSLIRFERQGTSGYPLSSYPLMIGEPLALRVWEGGWLVHSSPTFAVGLALSDTPSYEWYVVSGGVPPGSDFDTAWGTYGVTVFALWNSEAQDYLVVGNETCGVNLNWYQMTQGGGSAPPQGYSSIIITNCYSGYRPLEIWVIDQTAGTGWQDMGTLDSQYVDGACPATGQPWTLTLAPGHTYFYEAVDFSADGCENAPYGDPGSWCVAQHPVVDVTGAPNGPPYLGQF